MQNIRNIYHKEINWTTQNSSSEGSKTESEGEELPGREGKEGVRRGGMGKGEMRAITKVKEY